MVNIWPEQQKQDLDYASKYFSGNLKFTEGNVPNIIQQVNSKGKKIVEQGVNTPQAKKVLQQRYDAIVARLAEIDAEITFKKQSTQTLDEEKRKLQKEKWALEYFISLSSWSTTAQGYDQKSKKTSVVAPKSSSVVVQKAVPQKLLAEQATLSQGVKLPEKATKKLRQKVAFEKIQAMIADVSGLFPLPPIVEKFQQASTYQSFGKTNIKAFQKVIGFTRERDIDGFLGKNTYNQVIEYLFRLKVAWYEKKRKEEAEELKDWAQHKEQVGEKTKKKHSEQKNVSLDEALHWVSYVDVSPVSDVQWWTFQSTSSIDRTVAEEKISSTDLVKQPITVQNVPKIKKSVLTRYDISDKTKKNISGAKFLAGERIHIKTLEDSLKTVVADKRKINTSLSAVQDQITDLEAHFNNPSPQDLEKDPLYVQNTKLLIQQKYLQLTILQGRLDTLDKEAQQKSRILRQKQIYYLRTVQATLQQVKRDIVKETDPATLHILQEKFNFLTAIERSQRMLVGLDAQPNRFWFYVTDTWVVLRQSGKRSWTPDVDSDLDQGFYDIDEFWRLVYFDNTSQTIQPRVFNGFVSGTHPPDNGFSTLQVVMNGKKEIIGASDYDRDIEQREFAPEKQINSWKITEAQDNLRAK